MMYTHACKCCVLLLLLLPCFRLWILNRSYHLCCDNVRAPSSLLLSLLLYSIPCNGYRDKQSLEEQHAPYHTHQTGHHHFSSSCRYCGYGNRVAVVRVVCRWYVFVEVNSTPPCIVSISSQNPCSFPPFNSATPSNRSDSRVMLFHSSIICISTHPRVCHQLWTVTGTSCRWFLPTTNIGYSYCL